MYWMWTDRGFYSELNILVYACLLREQGETLYLDLSQSNIGFDSLEQIYPGCLQWLNIIEVNGKAQVLANTGLDYDEFVATAKRNFAKVWNANLDQRIDNSMVAPIISRLTAASCGDEKYNQFVIGNHHQPYGAAHIRRGDKLLKEADFIGINDFLTQISSQGLSNLYIASDDRSVFSEAAGQGFNLFFDDGKGKGHFQKEFNALPKQQLQAEVLRLVSEVKILCESDYFVGDYASNIARYVAMSKGFENSHSIGIEFAHFFEAERKPLLKRLAKKAAVLKRKVF